MLHLMLGGGAPRSAAENVNHNEAVKYTENAGSERECHGVTWRARSFLSVRSTVEAAEHPWSSWSVARRLEVRR